MAKLAKATGAKIITNTEELSKDDIGYADLIEERNVETDKWVFIEGCKNPKSITVLIRGGSQRVIDEAERSMHDALMVVKDAVEYPYVVVGGGAPEVVVSKKVARMVELTCKSSTASYREICQFTRIDSANLGRKRWYVFGRCAS
jgi:archaeal chaperonin